MSLRPNPILMTALAGMLALSACGDAALGPASRAPDSQATAPLVAEPALVEVTAANVASLAGAPGAGGAGWQYRPGPGDVLQLQVTDAPELTVPGGYRVGDDGAIELPYLGRLPVADQSVAAIREQLTARLRPYITSPQVELQITDFNARHISVVGEVRQPNRQTLTDRPLTVIDAINAAGGLEDRLRTPPVAIRRGETAMPVDLAGFLTEGRALPVLQDGDVLLVGGAAARAAGRVQPAPALADRRIRLQGPGGTTMLEPVASLTLAQAAAMGRMGQDDIAYVLRGTEGASRALIVAGAAASDPAVGGRLALQPGDAVLIAAGAAQDPRPHRARIAPMLAGLAR